MLKTFFVSLDLEKQLYDISNLSFRINTMDLNVIDFAFEITQDGANVNLTDTLVQLAILKPSGLTVYEDCEITDAAAGTGRITLSNQTYNEFGTFRGELILRQNEQIAVTCPFYYGVKNAILSDETIESTNDWSALQEALFSYDKKPVLTDGVPTFVPEYVGQMAFDEIGLRAFISNGLTLESWQLLAAGEGGGGGGIVYWNDIIAKPLSFTPAAHTHPLSEVEGLEDALANVEGTVGPAGPEGPMGPQGPIGLTGLTGPSGPSGPSGPVGPIGPKGDTGLTGATGSQGPKGDIGLTGPIGPTGLTGEIGPMGPQGPEGPEGAAGTGVTILGSYATEAELNAAHPSGNVNGDAYIVAGDLFVWNGAYFENVGRIQGPEGDVGPAGPIGPQGVKGDTGLTGATGPAGEIGPIGPIGLTGPQGEIGPVGDIGPIGPAGPIGLTGATGPQGPQGPIGLTGDAGEVGPVGPIGLTGPKGDTGDVGPAGPTGPQGPIGLTGPQGIQGVKGDTGATGLTGATGPIGLTGATGPQGPKGDTGDTGPAGPTGTVSYDSPSFTGNPTAPNPAFTDNDNTIATTFFVQGQGYLKTIPLMGGNQIGGAMVGNGLAMSTNYLYVKQGASLGIAGDNSLQVQTSNTTPAPLKFWTGNQTTYDGLTKDANTLYFISG